MLLTRAYKPHSHPPTPSFLHYPPSLPHPQSASNPDTRPSPASEQTQVTPSKPQTQLNSNIKMSSATPQKNTTNDATAGLNDESRGYPKPIGPKPPPKPTREGGEAADSQSTEEKKE